jgi:hypothetical protein
VTALSETPLLSITGTYGRWDGLVTLATYTSLTWFALWSSNSESAAYRWCAMISWSAYLVSVVAILGSFTLRFSVGDSAFEVAGFPRAVGTLGNPTALAQFLVLAVPVSVVLSQRTHPVAVQWLSAVRTATLLIALLLTFSRLAWAAGLVGLVIVVWRGWFNLAWRRSLGSLVIATTAGSVLLLASADFRIALLARLSTTTTTLVDGSAGVRLGVWADAIRMATQRLPFGFGPDTFGLVFPAFESADWVPHGFIDRAHSAPLQLLVDTGLLGLGFTLAVVVVGVTRAVRSSSFLAPGVVGGLLGYSISVVADIAYSAPLLLVAVVTGVALSLRARKPGRQAINVSVRNAGRGPGLVGRAAVLAVGVILFVNALRLLGADVAFRRTTQSLGEGAAVQATESSLWSVMLAPEQPVYHSIYGDALMQRGELQRAESEYQTAMALGSTDVDMLQRLAETGIRLGHTDLAVSAARRAAQISPYEASVREFLRLIENR